MLRDSVVAVDAETADVGVAGLPEHVGVGRQDLEQAPDEPPEAVALNVPRETTTLRGAPLLARRGSASTVNESNTAPRKLPRPPAHDGYCAYRFTPGMRPIIRAVFDGPSLRAALSM